VQHLDQSIRRNDLLVMLSAREGSMSWRPALNRLPRVLSQRFSNVNFVTIYPSEEKTKSARTPHRSSDPEEALPIAAIRTSLPEAGIEGVAMHLLQASHLPPANHDAIVRDLLSGEEALSPEVRPGVVLLHARSAAVTEPITLIGTSKTGLRLPRCSGPTHVVIVVISPAGTEHAVHVQALGRIARKVRADHVVEALRDAENEAGVRAVLARSEPAGAARTPGS